MAYTGTRTVIIEVNGQCQDEVLFSEFMADNEFSPEETADINHAMYETGEYTGGGGAAPTFRIRDPWYPK